MVKIPSDPSKATTNLAVPVSAPVYLAPERCASLSDALVDFEAYLLDESGTQAKFVHLRELADSLREVEIAEQVRLKEAALAEERRGQKGTALDAAMRRVEETAEMAHGGWSSEEDSEPDFESSSSSSSCSSSSDSEAMSFRPVVKKTKTKTKKAPSKPPKNAKPYDRPITPPPRPPPQEFIEFFVQAQDGTKTALGENEYWIHSIDWENAPLVWAGEQLPRMAADEVVPWLTKEYKVSKSECDGKCKFAYCPDPSREKASGLKNHILSSSHLNLRRKCHICRFACRTDMFDRRHNCRAHKARNAELIRESPGWPTPSYTWPAPSNA